MYSKMNSGRGPLRSSWQPPFAASISATHFFIRLSLFVVVIAGNASTSEAQQYGNQDSMQACALLDIDQRRYACYDRVMGIESRPGNGTSQENSSATMQPAPAAFGPAVTFGGVPKPQKREQFGLPEPRPELEGQEFIRVVVAEVHSNPYGKLIFTMRGGQVWEQTDQRTARAPNAPYNATIREASFGGYFLRANEGHSIRVRRKK